jgi:hypothetical protein
MQASPHGEEVMQAPGRLLVRQFMKRDQGKRFCTEGSRVLKTKVPLKLCVFPITIVPLLTGNLARTTTDAFRDVDERRFDGA